MNESIYLKELFQRVFDSNHNVKAGHNPDSIFLIGFIDEHFNDLEKNTKQALKSLKKTYKFINCKGKTFREIVQDIKGVKYPTEHDAMVSLKDIQLNSNLVIVFRELSKAKLYREKYLYFRGLIKHLDDAHYKNIQPKSDLIFIDSASFLERHFEEIGLYLVYNIWPNNQTLSEYFVKMFYLKRNAN